MFANLETLVMRPVLKSRYRRRTRNLRREARRRLERSRRLLAKVAVGFAQVAFNLFLEGGRMVREVGPGMKPQERYEFERNIRDQIGSGSRF